MSITLRCGANGLALRRMAIVAVTAAILVLSAGIVLADNSFNPSTADQISGMKHGERVLLTGHVSPLSENHYNFSDDSGTITILMTDAQWQAAHATAEDMVVLHGTTTREGEDMMFRVRRANKAE